MLEIISSSLYFINKIFLLFGKKAGWSLGILASIITAAFYIEQELYILLVLEIGMFLLMVYGYLNHDNTSKIGLYINLGIAAIMVYVLFNIEKTSVTELGISFIFMLATYLLSKHYWNYAWSLVSVGHLIMAIFCFNLEKYYFGSMQVFSVFVALAAVYKGVPKKEILSVV